jgi:hypothetical protein
MPAWLWPWHSFTIDCDLPPDLAALLIADRVAPKKWFGRPDKPFQGTMEGTRFEFSRVIGYKNSFLPWVAGEVVPAGVGSRVQVRMQLHPLVQVFMAVWLGFVGIICIVMLAKLAQGESIGAVGIVVPLGMFAFGWAMTAGGFWMEAGKQERMLREIFAEPPRS